MHKFSFCPNCKSSRIEFPNFHRFECFDCGMVFYENTAAAVAIILEKDDKILFTVRNQEPKKFQLDLPGGFCDPGETLEETCARELKEELNIQLLPAAFRYFTSAPNSYAYKSFTYKTADAVFIAQLPDSLEITLEEEEIKAVKWIAKSSIRPDEIAFDSLQKAIKKYLASNP